MMLNAVKKSTISSTIRWSKLSSGVATTRSLLSSKQVGKNVHHRSIYSAANQSTKLGKGHTNHQLVRMTSSIINTNYYDATGIAASAIAGGGAGRFPIGNPSTIAFLGIRSKSSGAAFSHSIEDDADVAYDTTAATANGGGVGRSHQEAWMVNLDRGDNNKWLSRPRSSDWFTGLEPSICPGELSLCIHGYRAYVYLRCDVSLLHMMR